MVGARSSSTAFHSEGDGAQSLKQVPKKKMWSANAAKAHSPWGLGQVLEGPRGRLGVRPGSQQDRAMKDALTMQACGLCTPPAQKQRQQRAVSSRQNKKFAEPDIIQ